MRLHVAETGALHVQFVFLIVHSFCAWIRVWVIEYGESHTSLFIVVRNILWCCIVGFLVEFFNTFLVGIIICSVSNLSATITVDVFLLFVATIRFIIIVILEQHNRDIFVLSFSNFVVIRWFDHSTRGQRLFLLDWDG